jgi:plasmid maintenance system antidote protein VapI
MENKRQNGDDQSAQYDVADLAQIFNYPAIGELFSDNDGAKIEEFSTRLNSIRGDLERIIRHGNRAEADSALRANKGIETTLEFIYMLQKEQLEKK